MPRVIFGLQSAFSLWMLVDAAQRGAAYYWYPIILMPFGEIVYFFTVKVHDPEFLWMKNLVHRITTKKVTLDELRYRFEHGPSYENHIALATALYDGKQFQDARPLFEGLLRNHPESSEALLGLALCLVGLEDYPAAVEPLQTLRRLEPAYQDYEAWTTLANCLHRTGRLEEALEVARELVEKSPRLNHRIYHAHYLRLLGRISESREELEKGLLEHRHAPRFLRRKQGAWARQAKQMLRQLEAAPTDSPNREARSAL